MSEEYRNYMRWKHIENQKVPFSLSDDDFGTLCICALRYCHGRETYMPSLVLNIVRSNLHRLSLKDLKVMLDDCDYQVTFNLFGDETIDKPNWLKWREVLEKEIERRKDG